MRIIISPAKKMRVDTDSLPVRDLPIFLSRTEELCWVLRGKTPEELKSLWKCNDRIAALNLQRLQIMDLRSQLTPAVLAYDGIQYQYMAPNVFTGEEYEYIQEHLRILSGFYGVLKPFDGVTAYRLEMQAKLKVRDANNLYSYWGSKLAEHLFQETDCIVNLASREYSQCVSKYLRPGIRFVTCVFGEEKDGKIVEKGTLCKMARGEMVRFLAERQAKEPEAATEFNGLGHQFDSAHSDENTLVFLRK